MSTGVNIDITANLTRFSSNLDRATQDLNRFQTNAQRESARSAASINALGNSIKSLAVGYVGVSALSGLARDILDTNRSMESLRMQLSAVEGSADGARMAFDFITKFAVETPFEIDGLTKSFVMLQNFGINPTKSVMEALTNQAAKLGGSQETLAGITLALGQAYSKGKLQAEEMNQLVERGVPVYKLLAEVTGKTTDEIMGMSKAVEINREVIDKLIIKMGELASGSNAKAMDTLNGKISNLGDSWHQFEDALMQDKSEGFIKSIVSSISESLNILTRNMSGSLDSQISHAKARVAEFNSLGVAGKFVSDMTGYDVNVEKNKLEGLQRRKEKQDASDEEIRNSKLSAAAIAQTSDWLAELEASNDEKTKKSKKGKKTAITDEQKAVNSLAKEYDNLVESLTREVALHGDNTEAAKMEYEVINGSLTALSEGQKLKLLNLAAEKDAIEINIKAYEEYDQVIEDGLALAKKQRSEMAADQTHLSQKFDAPRLDLNAGISDAMDARASGIIPNDAALKQVLDKMGQDYNDLTDKATKSTDTMSEFAVQAAHNMQSAFADFLFDPFKDGMDGMAVGFLKVLQKMAADAAATQILGSLMGTKSGDGGGLLGTAFSAIAGGIGSYFGGGTSFNGTGMLKSFANANGNAFSAGSVIPFASGGVFDKPTNFPMSGGRTGLMGEAGPEAIMPLTRGPGGKLGVMAIGGGGDVQISTQVTVSGGNNNSDSNMAALGGMINARIREVIVTEKRPNGLLA